MGQNSKLRSDDFFTKQTYTAGTGKNAKLLSSNFFIGLKFFGVRTGGTQAGHWSEMLKLFSSVKVRTGGTQAGHWAGSGRALCYYRVYFWDSRF